MRNPSAPANAPVTGPGPNAPDEPEYAGFWIRFGAFVIDSVLVMLLIAPILWWIYGPQYFLETSTSIFAGTADVLLSYVFPAIAVVIFWITRQATPGKMLLSMKIVDAQSGGPLSTGQAIGRYLGYYVSMLGLFLGLLWVAFDPRKQGWHDKLAGTVVVRERRRISRAH